MAPPVDLNYLAVLVSGIAAQVFGALWYGPLFGKTWMKLMGYTQQHVEAAKKKGDMWKYYLINFIATLLFAYVLAHFADYMQASTFRDALQLGFWIWLGFIATIMLSSILWESRPVKLYLLNISYRLVEILIISIILVLWP